jgi:hypothetical protein
MVGSCEHSTEPSISCSCFFVIIIIIIVIIAGTCLSMQQYVMGILLCWISAAVWAIPPLLGWGRSLSVYYPSSSAAGITSLLVS